MESRVLRRNACSAMNFMSETDTEEGALNSAQMHRGDSVLRWGVILQGEEEDTHRYREAGSKAQVGK